MGTSKGYGMPTGGEWTPLKNEATRFVKDAAGNNDGQESLGYPERILSRFIVAYGGSRRIAVGRGGGAEGSGGRTGSTARRAGAALGSFLSDVANHGLEEGLRRRGLSDLIGKSSSEVISGILEAFVGPASTLEDEAARFALAEIKGELFEGAESFEDIDKCLTENVAESGVFSIIVKFFAKYIFRLFCVNFYEVWQQKVGESQASSKLSEIKNYINLRTERVVNDGTYNGWDSGNAERLSQKVLQATLRVYEVNE